MSTDNSPWFKQFWPWFIIAIPATSVVMGVLMIYLAVTGEDSLVRKDWYKDGMAINQQLAKQERADQLNIKAFLTWDKDKKALYIDAENLELGANQQLTLRLTHPTLERRDLQMLLSITPQKRFYTRLPAPPEGFYHALLTAPGASWEISTGINFSNKLQQKALHKSG